MRIGRPILPLALIDDERETLERWARRPTTAQALALRARVILGCAANETNTRIARQLRVTKQTVGKWRSRFLAKRLDGLLDDPRPRGRRPHAFVGPGRTWLFAAPGVVRGKTFGQCHRRHRAVEFRRFLDTIEAAVPADLDVHLILDNYATHKTPAIRRWLAKRPRFHVHFTPIGASWINLVERWFALLTQKQLRRGVHRSTRALETTILDYIALSNTHPKPLVWTKSADEILASVQRFCRRISDSRH